MLSNGRLRFQRVTVVDTNVGTYVADNSWKRIQFYLMLYLSNLDL